MLYKEIFRFNDAEIKKTLKTIQKESKNPLYKQFYREIEGGDEFGDTPEDSDTDSNSNDRPDVDSSGDSNDKSDKNESPLNEDSSI